MPILSLSALEEVFIDLSSEKTVVHLQFDLAVNAASCDTKQFLLQTLDGAVTFIPLHKAICEAITNYNYASDSEDSTITFDLHPSDHIRLHSMAYNQLTRSYSVVINIGSTFIHTPGQTGVTPLYFMDMLTARVYIDRYNTATVLAFHLDLINAEFNMHVTAPIVLNISSVSYVSLSCYEQSNSGYIQGMWSTPQPGQSATKLSVKISPISFEDVCVELPCLEDGYALLKYFSPFHDTFGNSITSDAYQNTLVRCTRLKVYIIMMCILNDVLGISDRTTELYSRS